MGRHQRRREKRQQPPETERQIRRALEVHVRESRLIRMALALNLENADQTLRCFVCGHSDIEGAQMTREHIIPRWILSHHQLFGQTIHLLNGKQYAYRKLTTPTCQTCNHAMSKVEGRLKRAFLAQDVAWLRSPEGEDDLILLMGKIYIGLRAKQLTMRDYVNARPSIFKASKHDGTADPYIIYILQTLRCKTTIRGCHTRPDRLPATGLAFRCASDDFQLMDDNLGNLFIRVNGISILASLRDCGHAGERLACNSPKLLEETLGIQSGTSRKDLKPHEELMLWYQMSFISTRRIDDGLRLHDFDHVNKTLLMAVDSTGNYSTLDRDEEREFVQKHLLEHDLGLEFVLGAPESRIWL